MKPGRNQSTCTCAIGVDVGGTKIAAGIVAFPKGEVRHRRQVPTAPGRGGKAVLDDVARLGEELHTLAGQRGCRVEGIGIGICELVDLEGKVASENCIGWKRLRFRERLSNLAPTVIEADVRAAALAEAMVGAGKPFRQFLFITVGTGISCCLILDGQPFKGAHGAAGTMASSPLSVPCEVCGRLTRRTLEEIASGAGLVARFNQSQPANVESAEAVLAAARAGDPDATRIVRTGAESLGATTGWLVNVLDPEAIVMGGGLGLSKGLFWETFVAATHRHIWAAQCRRLPILRAATGRDAGVIGAAASAVASRRFQV